MPTSKSLSTNNPSESMEFAPGPFGRDGSIINFDGQIFENTIVKSKSLRYLAKTFSLSEATVGSIIEYKYTINLKTTTS